MTPGNDELLARLDERTKAMQADTVSMRIDLKNTIELMSSRLNDIEAKNLKKLEDIEQRLNTRIQAFEDNYVSKNEFGPVRILVYGFVGVVILTVIGALLSTVIVKN